MSAAQEICLPDIGDFEDVEIIEIPVNAGDTVAAEDTLLTLESDKASMDIPVPAGGVVRQLLVKVGDRVSKGVPLALIEPVASDGGEGGGASAGSSAGGGSSASAGGQSGASGGSSAGTGGSAEAGVVVAGAGGGGTVPVSGVGGAVAAPPAGLGAPMSGAPEPVSTPVPTAPPISAQPAPSPSGAVASPGLPHASPSVRRFAREVGVDLKLVRGTGRKGRISKDDVKAFIKPILSSATVGNLTTRAMPVVDFSKFGPITMRPLSRIRRRSAQNLARNWAIAPHVTQFDEADITGLEDFRALQSKEAAKLGVKLTLLPFILKAVADALARHPEFSASLAPDGEHIILKDYCHLGIAVNTDSGLVVPVLRDVNKKGLLDLARELSALSEQAQQGRLGPEAFQGGCFTVSNLGGVGGGHFTPIINAPELAILGVSRAAMRPVWNGEAFVPQRILPFSLSYDHRVIDGVAGARFTRYLAAVLEDIRRVLL